MVSDHEQRAKNRMMEAMLAIQEAEDRILEAGRKLPTLGPVKLAVRRDVEAIVDCDAEDDEAYRAAWERLRLSAADWLSPPDKTPRAITKEHLRRGFEALFALQEPLGVGDLAERLGVCRRSAYELLEAMRAAALPVRSVRCRNGRLVRYSLAGPRWHLPGKKRGPVVAWIQLRFWPEDGAKEG